MVSIIIPCYNQAQYLDECLRSILNQTYKNWECIIVNDGSLDNVEEIAKKWLNKDTRFKYLKKENGGLSSARNAGIEIAEGEFILPLDADDYISSNYLDNCLNKIKEDKNIKIVYGKAFKFGLKSEIWELEDYSFKALLKGNMIFCTALFRKKDWEINGGYDLNMNYGWEDWEFWINMLKRGGSVVKIDTCIFYYRIKENSMLIDLSENKEKMSILHDYIFQKHKDCFTNLTTYQLYIENQNLLEKLNNIERFIPFTDLIAIMIKKIKNIFKIKNYN